MNMLLELQKLKQLTIQELAIQINDRILFNSLSITILPGAIICIVGPNGIGKTSLFRVIAGVANNYTGKISFGKVPINRLSKPYCTYINHNLGLQAELSVYDNLSYWARFYGTESLIQAAVIYFNLEEFLDTKIFDLSEGERKKISLAKLIICQTNLWLLDEIETNLDKQNLDLLKNLINAKAAAGGIILINSHDKSFMKANYIDLASLSSKEENI